MLKWFEVLADRVVKWAIPFTVFSQFGRQGRCQWASHVLAMLVLLHPLAGFNLLAHG
jgi:hypothetical protein